MYKGKCPIIVGHRANSFRRLNKYLSMNVPIIEIDVIRSDDDIMLQHIREEEEIIKGIHKREGLIRALSDIYLRLLYKYRLIDALRLVNGRAGIMIDLKNRNMAQKTVEIIKKSNFSGEIFITSKYHGELREIKKLLPTVKALITLLEQPVDLVEYLKEINVDGVSMVFAFIDKEIIEELHKNNYVVAVWTINDVNLAKYLASINVDMIVTDIPEKMMRIFSYPKRSLRY